jgi:hypothetical protein
MELINRLRTYYEQYPPHLSYGGNEGKNVTGKPYQKWPTEEEFDSLGIAAVKVWHKNLPARANAFPIEGYCVVDACLDESGRLTPNALPLWPEMEGHELLICVYVDRLDRIHMRAIGGFTSFETRAAIRSA